MPPFPHLLLLSTLGLHSRHTGPLLLLVHARNPPPPCLRHSSPGILVTPITSRSLLKCVFPSEAFPGRHIYNCALSFQPTFSLPLLFSIGCIIIHTVNIVFIYLQSVPFSCLDCKLQEREILASYVYC